MYQSWNTSIKDLIKLMKKIQKKKVIERIQRKLKREGFLKFIIAVAIYPFRYQRRKAYKNMLKLKNPKERFLEIYKKKLWSSKESVSGAGSDVASTLPLRKWLILNITKLKIKSFVDAPCGDFNWMKLVIPEVDINYIGLDIVDEVISKNKFKFESEKVNFKITNICKDELPSCDIIMVRDCLFHLSYYDINQFLINLSKTNYKYLLTTTHIVENGFKNSDITTGDFKIIDLFSEPFDFDSKLVKDRVNDFIDIRTIKREMILVEKQYVPTYLPKLSIS